MYIAHTVYNMTAAVASGDVAKSAFCASLAKDLYQDVWAVRDEFGNLVVRNDEQEGNDIGVEVEEPEKKVPSIDFPTIMKTYESEVNKEKEAKRKEVEEKAIKRMIEEGIPLKSHIDIQGKLTVRSN